MVKKDYSKYFDLNSLIKSIKKYLPDFDDKKFRKAFEFAENAHFGQLRKDNETPYIVHPVTVVSILTEIHAGQDVLISALLHDVPEDTSHTIFEIKKLFGEKVAFLVDGITKLAKVHYQSHMAEREVESLKKLLLHSIKDPRVILIKLADRLHNMRTLHFIDKPEKRLRISKETLEVYVPIANLIGIQAFKSELENLCFKYIFPAEYEKLREKTEGNILKHKDSVCEFVKELSSKLRDAKIKAKILEKEKNSYNIYKKIKLEGKTINEIKDRIAIRIVVDDVSSCYQALGIIHGLYVPKVGRFKDYIASPKMNGYQSLHTTVFGIDGILTEIQIRTTDMQKQANYGLIPSLLNKRNKDNAFSSWISDVLESDNELYGSENFLEQLKSDVFQDKIFVFTPMGKRIDLPSEASVIDFAYAVSDDFGNHACKAEINGHIYPILTKLKTGDIVEIITSEDSTPEISWLSFTKTNIAKSKIREYLGEIADVSKLKEGKKILQQEFDMAGLDLITSFNFKKLKGGINAYFHKDFESMQSVFIAIGEGNLKAIDIVKSLTKKGSEGINVTLRIVAKNRFGLLRDISDILYKYSSDMTHLKGYGSNKQDEAYFSVKIMVDGIEDLENIFHELEKMDGFKSVHRISYVGIYFTYAFAIFTIVLWIIHPVLIHFIDEIPFAKNSTVVFNAILDAGLLILFLCVFYLTDITKKYFPIIRNKRAFLIFSMGVPIIASFLLLFELFYFDLKLSWTTLIIEIAMIYAYLGFSFVNFKKYLS
ncbi:(p)ppGpp synthetase [Candidatus Peregrinibacteria bacterium CG_4_10_14_0_2_um_filter_38_24]|nr:MAG: (p)ppGpp synthetase [Candidatus Peregrinibacteria bacterium CG_4_10_14_0_2_um_filter_38_24]PJC39017.1 MAG: (p)ppGpp synthetase [Candidatus Peregrinibacteria bacterium CG_4_9_14_0_2_um_filter_38_9]